MSGAQDATNGVTSGAQDATNGVTSGAEAAKTPLAAAPLAPGPPEIDREWRPAVDDTAVMSFPSLAIA